jgi:hypothetical protein
VCTLTDSTAPQPLEKRPATSGHRRSVRAQPTVIPPGRSAKSCLAVYRCEVGQECPAADLPRSPTVGDERLAVHRWHRGWRSAVAAAARVDRPQDERRRNCSCFLERQVASFNDMTTTGTEAYSASRRNRGTRLAYSLLPALKRVTLPPTASTRLSVDNRPIFEAAETLDKEFKDATAAGLDELARWCGPIPDPRRVAIGVGGARRVTSLGSSCAGATRPALQLNVR